MNLAGYGAASFAIPVADFYSLVAQLCPEIPETIIARGGVLRVGAADQARLRGLLDAIEDAAGDSVTDFCGEARRNIERDLLETYLAAFRSGWDHPLPPRGPRLAGRYRRLHQAVDFILGHPRQPVHLADLCSELGLSRRGVENLFHDLLGVGPSVYVRHQRLHGARRALLQAAPLPGRVKQVALEWGFWHLGRFARDYRLLFGESPSETMAGVK